MPFKGVDVMDVKKEFVLKSLDGRAVFTELCREYGIGTKCGYKWRQRFLEEGYAGLEEHSRKPLTNSRGIPEPVSVELIRIKKLHPAWGAKKILAIYKRNHAGNYAPVRSAVENLFARAGYTGVRRRRNLRGGQIIQHRKAATKPNEVWTVDFKGWWYTKNKERVTPLTIRDEYSKYILAIDVVEKGDTASVKRVFERVFKHYGLPGYIRSDFGLKPAGPPFACVLNYWGLTKLSVWWMTQGIQLDRDDPGHPEQNGGHERMHRDMKTELQGQIDGSLNEHQKVFDKWRKDFNKIRPHEALGMKVPADIYTKSLTKYTGEYVELKYGRGFKMRMINDRGFLNINNLRIFVGNPFAGYHAGVKEFVDKPTEVWFGNFLLGKINPDTGLIEPSCCIIQVTKNT
jgi:transposase InsO family protein